MSFVCRFFVDLSQVLSDCLIFSGFVLELAEFFSLRNDLNDILQFDVLIDSLDISCQGFNLDVIVAANNTQVG